MSSFAVRVMNSAGKPRTGVRVGADFGVLSGVATAYTDSDGWARLRFAADATATIYVDGESQGDHYVSDEETLSFTVDYA